MGCGKGGVTDVLFTAALVTTLRALRLHCQLIRCTKLAVNKCFFPFFMISK